MRKKRSCGSGVRVSTSEYHSGVVKHPRRPRDTNALAAQLIREATGQVAKQEPEPAPDPSSRAGRGLKGGSKGGATRAARLPAKRRSEIASQAAKKRWKKG